MTLFEIAPRKPCKILSLSETIPKKLVDLGFVPGSKIEVLRRNRRITIVLLRRRKYAMRDVDATKITVG